MRESGFPGGGMGRGFFMPGHGQLAGQAKAALEQLGPSADMGEQLEALTQLCELLSVVSEDQMAGFPLRATAEALLRVLGQDDGPELMLLAARALTYLMDTAPQAAQMVAGAGGAHALCARLLSVEYIDLAEQSLQALELLSKEWPAACLEAGGLVACLSFLDFFPTSVQRGALRTAVNIVKGLRREHADLALAAAPLLMQHSHSHDKKISEPSCMCLVWLTRTLAKTSASVDALCEAGVLGMLSGLVGASCRRTDAAGASAVAVSLGEETRLGCIQALAACARSSTAAAESLLSLSLLEPLFGALKELGRGEGTPAAAKHLESILALLCDLLPPLPDPPASMQGGGEEGAGEEGATLEKFLRGRGEHARYALFFANADILRGFTAKALPVIAELHGHAIFSSVRSRCLETLTKTLFLCSSGKELAECLEGAPLPHIFAKELFAARSCSDKAAAAAAGTALLAIELFLVECPEPVTRGFIKEGVVRAIDGLAATGVGSDGKSKVGGHSERVAAQAARLKGQYLPTLLKSREAKEVAAAVSHLRLLGESLLEGRSTRQTAKTVGNICDVLRGTEDPVSAPQLLESGLVHTLGLFLAGSDLREEADCAGSAAAPADDEPSSWAATAAERLELFLEAATVEQGAGVSALSVLQKKLVEAVGDLEQFTVTDARPAEEAFQTLGRPLRLRLKRAAPAAGEAPLRDFSQQVVLIEPLASVAAVTRFLAPRVQQLDNPRSSTRTEGAARREAASGAGALEEEQEHEEEEERQEDDEEEEEDGEDMSDAEWCEEDEELDDLDEEEMNLEDSLDGNDEPVDVGEGGDAEADVTDRDCRASRGGSRRGEAPAQQGQGASGAGEPAPPRSPTGASADPEAGGGLWRRGPPRPRPSGLNLRVISPEGETLEPTKTILETILQCSTPGAAEGNSSLPLWERVFTLQYRRAREGEEQKQSQGPSRRSSAVTPAVPGRAVILGAADLGKLVEARLGEADEDRLQLDVWAGAEKLSQVLKLLHLLQMARDVRRLGRRGGGAPADGGVAGSLVCGSAASKFAYQLQDILAVCGGSLPAWVSGCALRCPYLLPFKSRRDYFRLNAFGVQHALLHLQQGVAAAAAANGVAGRGGGGGGGGGGRARNVSPMCSYSGRRFA